MYYLELSSKNVVRFDSVSQLTNVFFDDSNKQVSFICFDIDYQFGFLQS